MRMAFPPGFDSEQLGYYVYMLLDPRCSPSRPFYVGKGVRSRLFTHVRDALDSPAESDKLATIREIRSAKLEPLHVVVRHGLTEKEAFEVEAAFIDYFGDSLSNAVSGLYSSARGLMTIDEVIAEYQADPLVCSEPCIAVIINKRYRRGMPSEEMYQATCRAWKLSEKRARSAKYVLAVARGIVREVYRPNEWRPCIDRPGRYEFDGCVSEDGREMIGKRIDSEHGAANPVRYINLRS